MPRKPRTEVPGGFFHVWARGNARTPIFLDDHDYEAWLRMLARTVEAFSWRCHAYCAMPNHFHLLLETPNPTRSAGMRHLNGSYAQRFNVRYDGSGHVFQGPYNANPIGDDSHFLETCRYIALNPVRAGICRDPGEWTSSSYNATAGIVTRPDFLTVELIYGIYGGSLANARLRYRQFVQNGHVHGPGPKTVLRHEPRP